MTEARAGGYLARPAPSGLADVVEIILDKGLVIDAYARVSLVGIEVLTIDARVVVSSVDTYLRFAEATNRLDLWDQGGRSPVDLMSEGVGAVVQDVAASVAERKVDSAFDRVGDTFGEPVEEVARAATRKVAHVVERVAAKALDTGDS